MQYNFYNCKLISLHYYDLILQFCLFSRIMRKNYEEFRALNRGRRETSACFATIRRLLQRVRRNDSLFSVSAPKNKIKRSARERVSDKSTCATIRGQKYLQVHRTTLTHPKTLLNNNSLVSLHSKCTMDDGTPRTTRMHACTTSATFTHVLSARHVPRIFVAARSSIDGKLRTTHASFT